MTRTQFGSVLMGAWVVALLGAAGAIAQVPSLTINGVTSDTNGAYVEVPLGAWLVLEIQDAGNVGGPFALVAGVAFNARSTGWWIEKGFLLKKDGSGVTEIYPVPLLTGIPVVDIEAEFTFFDGSPVDLRPDLPGSHRVRLDGSGRAVHRLVVPFNENLTSITFQAVVRRPNGQLLLTNGVEVRITPMTVSAAIAAGRGTGTNVVTIGALDFTDDPANAVFTPDSEITNTIDFLSLQLSGVQWFIAGEKDTDSSGSQIDIRSYKFPSKSVENARFQYIAIPAAAGADGKLGTADDVPPRDLYRIKLNDVNLWGWLVVNHGSNPNTPGRRFFIPQGCLLQDSVSPTADYWRNEVVVSPNYDRILVATNPPGTSPEPWDRAKLVMIDGTTPFQGGTSAVLDVTPVPSDPFEVIEVPASTLSRTRVIIAASDNWSSTSFEKFYYWANVDGTGGVTNIPIPPVASEGKPVKEQEEDAIIWNDAVTCFTFRGGSSSTVHDQYAILIDRPGGPVCYNVSGISAKTKLQKCGDVRDGKSWGGGVSPNGQWIAYTAFDPATGDDYLYVAPSDGSLAGSNRLVNEPSKFNFSAQDDVRDAWFATDNLLTFWFGDAGGTAKMDMYRYNLQSLEIINVTGTSGYLVPDFDGPGDIYSRGEWLSESGRYLFCVRDGAFDPEGRDACNVIGVDLVTWTVFDLTGSEFSNGFTPDTNGPEGLPTADKWQLTRSPGAQDLVWFVSRFAAPTFGDTDDHQIWVMDERYPFAAYPITSFSDPSGRLIVDDPSPAGFGPILAYAIGITEINEDMYVIDLQHGLSNFNLTGTKAWAHEESSVIFVDPFEGSPGGLFYVLGTTISDDPTTNVGAYYFPLDGSTDPPRALGGVVTNQLHYLFCAYPQAP
ncbi:MAG: hypothetical protein AB1486_13440 [Planctomycetota bacterium]